MDVLKRRMLGMGAAALIVLPFSTQVLAADWPSRPIRIVVPYPAGGGPDLTARKMGEKLGPLLKTSIIVENKPGASGLLGVTTVAQAEPDGYTFSYVSSGHVTLQLMSRKFDLLKDLTPVALLTSSPFVAVVGPRSRYQTLAEMLADARANPGKISYGSAGIASPAHIAVEYLFQSDRSLEFLHVPYKGAVESINAIRSGLIDFSVVVAAAALPLIKSGELRALAVTPSERMPSLLDIPTFQQAGIENYEFLGWSGIMAPAKTGPAIIAKMSGALATVFKDAEFQEFLKVQGVEGATQLSPDALAQKISANLASEAPVVEALLTRSN